MRTLPGILLFILVSTFGSISSQAQTEAKGGEPRLVLAPGVGPHKGIDSIYERFSKAYDDLDPQAVADLYTESAAYLSPGSEIRTGRNVILENFTRSFESVKSRKERRAIRFRIVQREVEGGLGYDVGEFVLETIAADGAKRSSRGKFVTVTKLGKDGKWRFQVDGYSDIAEIRSAQTNSSNISVPHPVPFDAYQNESWKEVEARVELLAEQIRNQTGNDAYVYYPGETEDAVQLVSRMKAYLNGALTRNERSRILFIKCENEGEAITIYFWPVGAKPIPC